jgi:hypothetical protein
LELLSAWLFIEGIQDRHSQGFLLAHWHQTAVFAIRKDFPWAFCRRPNSAAPNVSDGRSRPWPD